MNYMHPVNHVNRVTCNYAVQHAAGEREFVSLDVETPGVELRPRECGFQDGAMTTSMQVRAGRHGSQTFTLHLSDIDHAKLRAAIRHLKETRYPDATIEQLITGIVKLYLNEYPDPLQQRP